MRSDLWRAGRLLVLLTIGLLVVIALKPGRVGLTVRIYALLVAGVALALALGALRRAYPPTAPLRPRAARRARRSRRSPSVLAQLGLSMDYEVLEQHALLGVASALDLHHLLRPHLRTVALGLLSARRRISLDDDPAASERILGSETWDLVRPDRPRPEDRLSRGISPADLRRVVESLEQI